MPDRHRLRILTALTLLGALALVSGRAAQARPGDDAEQSPPPPASDSGREIRFNISPNGYPPYLIVDQAEPSGIMWDVMKRVTEKLGYTLKALRIPRKRVDRMLVGGYLDATSRAREWVDNPDEFVFTDPIVAIEEVFFSPKDSDFRFQQVSDLAGTTLVTHLGYHYPALQADLDAGRIKRFDVPRDQDMFTYVLHGNGFDAAIADRLVGRWILRNQEMRDDFRISERGISHYGFRIMMRKDWQPFVDRFNQALAQLRDSGELDNILANYR